MSVESEVFDALKGLVANRCYPDAFPLTPPTPAWPAIRYSLVSEVPAPMLCGDTELEANTTRIQLDLVATTAAAVRSLRDSVIGAMAALATPAIREGGFSGYDAETKTYRLSMDYALYESST